MSIGALELQSLYRKYMGDLADIDLAENRSTQQYQSTKRDLAENRKLKTRRLADEAAARNMSNSGIFLRDRSDLERAYDRAGADADAQQQANLSQFARNRLNAKAVHDEGVALSKLTSLLEKQRMQ